jgi:hypothetical protein
MSLLMPLAVEATPTCDGVGFLPNQLVFSGAKDFAFDD